MEPPLSLDALRVLDAIATEGSFAAAAARLHRVPSAITYTVRNIEEDLGVALFDRSGHRAVLTEAGRLVVERGRELVDAGDALRAAARSLGDGWEAAFTVAADGLLEAGPVLELVARFRKAQPQVQLAISAEVLDGHWDALRSGRVDLAIGAQGQVPRGFASRPLGTPDWVLVCAPTHPAAALTPPIETAQLAGATAVLAADSSLSGPGRTVGLIGQRDQLRVPDLDWKLAAHRLGLGVGWAPRSRVQRDLDGGTLVALTPVEARAPEPLLLAWRRGARGRALGWFLDALEDAALVQSLLGQGTASAQDP